MHGVNISVNVANASNLMYFTAKPIAWAVQIHKGNTRLVAIMTAITMILNRPNPFTTEKPEFSIIERMIDFNRLVYIATWCILSLFLGSCSNYTNNLRSTSHESQCYMFIPNSHVKSLPEDVRSAIIDLGLATMNDDIMISENFIHFEDGSVNTRSELLRAHKKFLTRKAEFETTTDNR